MNVTQMRNCIQAVSEFEGVGISWYTVRGHVDKATFQEALRLEFDVTVKADDIEHIHVRNVPAGPDMPGRMWRMVCLPGPGAYPITSVDAPHIGQRVIDAPAPNKEKPHDPLHC